MLWPIGAYNRYTKQDNVTKPVAQVVDGLLSRAKVSLGKTLERQPACYGGRTACMAALPHTRPFNKQGLELRTDLKSFPGRSTTLQHSRFVSLCLLACIVWACRFSRVPDKCLDYPYITFSTSALFCNIYILLNFQHFRSAFFLFFHGQIDGRCTSMQLEGNGFNGTEP